jgi:hypothetical protein
MGIEPTGDLSPGRPTVLKTGAGTSRTRTPQNQSWQQLEASFRHPRKPASAGLSAGLNLSTLGFRLGILMFLL